MAVGSNSQPLSLLGDLPNGQVAVLRYTVSSGTVTLVKAPKGWSLGNFSSGIAALTFPKHYNEMFPFVGAENTTNASATSRHCFHTKTIDTAAGTASVLSVDDNDGTVETPADGTFRLCYLVSD